MANRDYDRDRSQGYQGPGGYGGGSEGGHGYDRDREGYRGDRGGRGHQDYQGYQGGYQGYQGGYQGYPGGGMDRDEARRRFPDERSDDAARGRYGAGDEYGGAGYGQAYDRDFDRGRGMQGGYGGGQGGGGADRGAGGMRGAMGGSHASSGGGPYGEGATGHMSGGMRGMGSSGYYGEGRSDVAGYGTGGFDGGSGIGGVQRQSYAGRGSKNYRRSDQRIEEDVHEMLMRHHEIDATDVDVRVENGEVTLSGEVEDRRARRLAEELVEQCQGVRDVHNELKARRGLMASIGDALGVGDGGRAADRADREIGRTTGREGMGGTPGAPSPGVTSSGPTAPERR